MVILRKTSLLLLALFLFASARSQKGDPIDSLPDYDALFNELEHFLDSITAPRSFTTVNIGFGNGVFQYLSADRNTMKEVTQTIYTPSAGYYNKNGLGINFVTSVVHLDKSFTPYQTAATLSYDYLKNRKFFTGVSFSRFFTKDSLPFYTSPLSNEANAYFSYRGWWLKCALLAGYGWGSITSVEQRKEKIKLLKKKPLNGTTTIETTESIADFSLTASVKHDFYWLNVLSKRDFFRVTPQIALTGGTQRYGLAQTNSLYVSEKQTGASILYNTDKNFVAAQSKFQLLALSARLRTEVSKGIFFLQPQLIFDYYFPERNNNVVTAFVVNAGILF
jgi:hypothetical protein